MLHPAAQGCIIRTFLRSVGLHEALPRAGLFELWGEPCELGQVFVDEPHLGRQAVVVQVAGEVAAGVACAGGSVSQGKGRGTRQSRGTYPGRPRSGRRASLPWRAWGGGEEAAAADAGDGLQRAGNLAGEEEASEEGSGNYLK